MALKATEDEKAIQTARSKARGEGKLTPTRQMLQNKLLARQTNAYTANAKNQGKDKALYPANTNLNLSPPQIGQPVSYGDAQARLSETNALRSERTQNPQIMIDPIREPLLSPDAKKAWRQFGSNVAQAPGDILSRIGNFITQGAEGSEEYEALRMGGNRHSAYQKGKKVRQVVAQQKAADEQQLINESFALTPNQDANYINFSGESNAAISTEDGIDYMTPKGQMNSQGGRLTPDQLTAEGYNPASMSGSFGVMPSSNAQGVDTSAMSMEERSAFNAKSYNDAADKVKADREAFIAKERGGRRMTPSGRGSSLDRDRILKEYKRDLRSVMGETGHYGGVKKAKIASINKMYGDILGLGQTDQEESGRTDRANIAADASIEREGINQAGRMAQARMTADAKGANVQIDDASGQPFILNNTGREWTNKQMVQMAAQWRTLEGKAAEEFAAQFLEDYNMMPNEVN